MKRLPDLRDWEAPDAYQRRYVKARELGLDEVLAREFAESDIRLSQLRKLIDKGCRPALALEILA